MKKSLLLLCMALSLFISCRKDTESCTQFLLSNIARHNDIYTGKAFEDIPIPVSYSWGNTCASKGYLEAEKDGDVTAIRAFASVYQCSGCFTMPVSFTDTFYFRAPRAGTYYLKYISSSDYVSVDTVVVQ